MTVDETFRRLPGQFRGLDTSTGTGEPARDLLPCPLVVEYEITGPEAGVWHVIADQNECQVARGPATDPFTRIRVTTEDWLALWAAETAVWTLLRLDRFTFTPEEAEVLDLPYLGLLGPAVESPRDAAWLSLHAIPRWRWGYFVVGSSPDFELSRHWGNRLAPNNRMLVAITVVSAASMWWVAGGMVAVIGAVVIASIAFWALAHLALKGERDPAVFRWALLTGLVTVHTDRIGK